MEEKKGGPLVWGGGLEKAARLFAAETATDPPGRVGCPIGLTSGDAGGIMRCSGFAARNRSASCGRAGVCQIWCIDAGGFPAGRAFWTNGVAAVYAIIEDGGRQYKVSSGDKLYVDLRVIPEGQDTIEFTQVLAVGEGVKARIGQPLVEGAKVVAKVVGELKGDKLRTYKFRRRKNYRRKIGHRQQYLEVTVSDIVC